MVAIFYTSREPETDLPALLHHVRQNAASLGIDENRIAFPRLNDMIGHVASTARAVAGRRV
jgi:hypothetical protein